MLVTALAAAAGLGTALMLPGSSFVLRAVVGVASSLAKNVVSGAIEAKIKLEAGKIIVGTVSESIKSAVSSISPYAIIGIVAVSALAVFYMSRGRSAASVRENGHPVYINNHVYSEGVKYDNDSDEDFQNRSGRTVGKAPLVGINRSRGK